MVGRDDDVAKSRKSDPAETTCVRRARDGLTDHPSRQEKVLTDGWNYEKVVVGSNLRVEIQIKSGHLHWPKKIQNIKEIDIQKPFHEYWSSGEHELTALGRSSSQTSPLLSDGEAQR